MSVGIKICIPQKHIDPIWSKASEINSIINSAISNQRNKNLIIIQPDKSSSLVLLNQSGYVNKINQILKNTSKFGVKQNEEDSVRKVEKIISEVINELVIKGLMTREELT